ncbi:MAG TPA: efflux RND transporter permease subunit, partial [Gemmataceae bacterium]|nr:efflux RND transporter permease subunit [Gemmataceae bacterium]
MVRKLLDWAVNSQLLVLVLCGALVAIGVQAFLTVNVEAYPDPAPPIIEVVAQFPGAPAEEVERLVTTPLEVALAGMPGLQVTRSKSLFGLSHLRNQFDYGTDFEVCKQNVINRLSNIQLPKGVRPQISPASPTGEILRYTLSNPRDALGNPLYTLNDLKALQDYTMQRELLRVPRIGGVVGAGGTVKRYEIQPNPDRLAQFGVSLGQLSNAVGNSNTNGSGDNLTQGEMNFAVLGIGLFGFGQDPMQLAIAMNSPAEAAAFLRQEEAKRAREIRQIVVASVNGVPVKVDQLVDGGPMLHDDGTPRVADHDFVKRGVVVSNQTRQGKVGISKPAKQADGSMVWVDYDEKIQGIVLLRRGQESLLALKDVKAKIEELNQPGHLLPGVQIEVYYDRTDLMNVTTETVHENLILGMALVSIILLMFLSNVRVTIIVAINIPLALLFAFIVLKVRGKSANLLSIGAVDFGIIVDSTVILVESIYRHLTTGKHADEPIAKRIVRACTEVERALFFSTIIMVCALLPLFTMSGPEGQIFGPMADTYAFALGGALLLALTVSPVLCCLLLKNLRPVNDNILVRSLQAAYLWQLRLVLKFRWVALALFIAGTIGTGILAANMGREFMPELEEGNLFVRGTFPMSASLDQVAERAKKVRSILQEYQEVDVIVSQIGRPDDGTDPTGYYNVEIFVPLKAAKYWPVPEGHDRPRTKEALIEDMNKRLDDGFPGVDWDFSQIIRDNVMEALSGVKGENSVKIFGPNLGTLEKLAEETKKKLTSVHGVVNVGIVKITGQTNLVFAVDYQKCAQWNVSADDVKTTLETAVGGQALSQMIEGEKTFDITLRWPKELRADEAKILAIPVDVSNNQVRALNWWGIAATATSGASVGLSPTGTMLSWPALAGNVYNNPNLPNAVPRRPLKDLVTSVDKQLPGYAQRFLRPGASVISREQGQRFIAVKFGVRNRDLAGAVAEAQAKVAPLIQANPGYRTEWSGEFGEMEEAEARLSKVFALSLVVIGLLLYMAFRSFLDAAVVFANVLAMALGGVWALKIVGLNFNISAAVGFISILGVAV